MKKYLCTKVLVAVSGGVDSAVAAALLQKAGFEVAGAFMKCWQDKDSFGECAAAVDVKVARQVARVLGMPLYTFDFTKEYRREVFNYFISEYKAGRTPNPDVVCNRTIKFGIFLKKALEMGFDYMATGHYVRLSTNSESSTNKRINEYRKIRKFANSQPIRYSLMTAEDKNKDQNYFLWQLGQEQLQHCLFPIGDYTKPEIREMAIKFGLPNAERKDSQGICFVGKVKLADFLAPHIKQRKGKIVDVKGKFLGWHPGVTAYTIGQRHGIGLPGGPYWVVDKDVKKNVLVVSRNEKDLYRREVILSNVNWISGEEPRPPASPRGLAWRAGLPMRVKAAIRYRQKPEPATLTKTLDATPHESKLYAGQGTYKLRFNRPQRAMAPGQSAVFWRGRELLGGGIICGTA